MHEVTRTIAEEVIDLPLVAPKVMFAINADHVASYTPTRARRLRGPARDHRPRLSRVADLGRRARARSRVGGLAAQRLEGLNIVPRRARRTPAAACSRWSSPVSAIAIIPHPSVR